MLFFQSLKKVLLISAILLTTVYGCKQDIGSNTPQTNKIKKVGSSSSVASNTLYTDDQLITLLADYASKVDNTVTPIVVETIDNYKVQYAFQIDRSYRLNHHLTKYNRHEIIKESLRDWFPNDYHDSDFHLDKNLAKFQFFNTLHDTTFNKFMDLCIISTYKIYDKNGNIVNQRERSILLDSMNSDKN